MGARAIVLGALKDKLASPAPVPRFRVARLLPAAGLGVCVAAATAVAARAEPLTTTDNTELLHELARATEEAVAALEASKPQRVDLLTATERAVNAPENKRMAPKPQQDLLAATRRAADALEGEGDSAAAASSVIAVTLTAAASDLISTLDQAKTASAIDAVKQYWVKGSSKPTMLATEMAKASGLRGLRPDELLGMFSAVDKILTKPALIRALSQADSEVVGQLFDLFAGDADGDGTADIDYRTFVCAAVIMADAKPAAKLRLMFKLCDDDATGDLTREELGETLRALLSAVSALSLNPHDHQAMAKFRLQFADAVMAEADVDNSGTITREEFATWAASGSELANFLSQSLLMFLRPHS